MKSHTHTTTRGHCRLLLLFLMLCSGGALLKGGQFHVRPGGLPSGDGSPGSPWDLQTALNNPPAVQPGDTIWLHGGTYRGTFESNLRGTALAPILVRSYPGEWAVFDNGGSNDTAFWLKGSHTWFWGLEVSNTGPTPTRNEGGVNFASSDGNKLINAIIHDAGSSGINPYSSASNAEIYGCLVYYNGRFEDSSHLNGYGVYGQNEAPSRKSIVDNFFFNMFGLYPAHMAGSSTAKIDNIRFTGNTFFGHTLYDDKNVVAIHGNFEPGAGKNLNPEWTSNYFYRTDLWLGYNGDGADSATVTDNQFLHGAYLAHPANTYLTLAGNIFSDSVDQVFVRPNAYADEHDPRRANIVVFNSRRDTSIVVTLPPGVLSVGDRYQLRDVQDYYGPPVAAGIHGGGPVVFPMPGSNDPITAPVSIPVNRPGNSPPRHTDLEFGAFILLANLENVAWPLGVDDRSLPGEYSLGQNYPNPCNPTTTIEFTLPVKSGVFLAVYNILGQHVATLADGGVDAGRHAVRFDGRNLASGLYFYRLNAGMFSFTRKLMLIH